MKNNFSCTTINLHLFWFLFCINFVCFCNTTFHCYLLQQMDEKLGEKPHKLASDLKLHFIQQKHLSDKEKYASDCKILMQGKFLPGQLIPLFFGCQLYKHSPNTETSLRIIIIIINLNIEFLSFITSFDKILKKINELKMVRIS